MWNVSRSPEKSFSLDANMGQKRKQCANAANQRWAFVDLVCQTRQLAKTQTFFGQNWRKHLIFLLSGAAVKWDVMTRRNVAWHPMDSWRWRKNPIWYEEIYLMYRKTDKKRKIHWTHVLEYKFLGGGTQKCFKIWFLMKIIFFQPARWER